MRKLIFSRLFLSFLLIGVFTITTYANNGTPTATKAEFTKTIKKNFRINSDGKVALTNKYGYINLNTWSKNEVQITVTITVKTRNESAASDVFDRIDVGFSNTDSYVRAETAIASQKSNWWGNNTKGDFRIDYEVNMPKTADLVLQNKYGDATIDAIGGDAEVTVKYGNFSLETVGGSTSIDLGYGNATVGNIKNGNVVIKYSKLKIKEAKQVNLESKYSKIYIESSDKLKTTTKYDTYDIGEAKEISNQGKYDHFSIEKVDHFSAYAKYSDFSIGDLYSDAEFELRYGGFKIENLHDGFDEILLECEYADCKIYMDDNASFQLDASADHSTIRYPDNLSVAYESKEDSNHKVQGHRGSKSAGKIKARLRYGGLKVR